MRCKNRPLLILVVLVQLLSLTVRENSLWAGDLPPRDPLDELWDQHMLAGSGNTMNVVIEVKDGQVQKGELPAKLPISYSRGAPESAGYGGPGISVMQLGEGFWENGGWILKGGLLGIAQEESSTIELHGKSVIHRLPYFPFPFHRDKPHKTGYEFFLLQRDTGSQKATVLRKWTFTPQEVALKPQSVGPPEEDVRATLEYDGTAKQATVAITGLTRPFKESVAVSERARTKDGK